MANTNQSMHSGEPGSTGRELFEGSTATGHGEKAPTYGTGYKEGTEAGDKGNHGEHDHDLGAGPHKRGTSGSTQQSSGQSGLTSGNNHSTGHSGTTGLTGGTASGLASSGDHGSHSATSGLTSGDHSSTSHTHTSNTHSHGVTGGHSGSGTGSLSGQSADISSALKVPHEEHALHGAGIQSIGGASIGGNHNPRSAAQEFSGHTTRDQGAAAQTSHSGQTTTGHGISGHNQGVSNASQGVGQGNQDTGRHGLTNQFDHSDDKVLAGSRREADLPTDGRINKDSLKPDNLLNRAGDKANEKADQKAYENGVQGGGNLEDKAQRAVNQSNH